MDRRTFLKTTAGAGALAFLTEGAYGYAVSPRLRKFVTPLPIFGFDIPIATPDITTYPGVDYYEIEAGAFRQQLHPDLPASGTRLFGYRQVKGTHMHLGSPIVAKKGRPVRLKFSSALPAEHILPFDATIPSPGNGGTRQDRAAIHLHGGLVPWTSDGGPFHWISNPANPGGFVTGASLPGMGWLPDATGALTNDYYYPNNQSARMMWYHDHAIGITRINAYAGIATGYLIVDGVETSLGIPVPGDILVVQDKIFYDPALDPAYATYAGPATLGGAVKGDLWYPYIYDPKIWKLAPGGIAPVPSCVAEMFGDTMLVNGVAYPYYDVSGMKRLRLLNACNARFLNLQFVVENTSNGEPKLNNQGVPVWPPVKVWQIGTEAGFLPAPVLLADTVTVGAAPPTPLLLAPAERADLIVDFSAVPAGTKVILYNDAPAPYPGGSPMFDWAAGTPGGKSGYGPNTRTLMEFRCNGAGPSMPIPTPPVPVLATVPDLANGGLMLAAIPGSLVSFNGADYIYVPTTQELTLNEAFDAKGRLMQLVGNVNTAGGMFGSFYTDGQGESVSYGTIQIWNIYNLTADAHPMHFHLFNVMVLRRRPFKVAQFNGVPLFTAAGRGPDVNETGWKETVKMYPGECTTVAVLVENPLPGRSVTVKTDLATYTGTLKVSQRTGSDEYVWHCHILEHEEHDMMHTLNAS